LVNFAHRVMSSTFPLLRRYSQFCVNTIKSSRDGARQAATGCVREGENAGLEKTMKVHVDPVTTTSLPVLLFLAEHDLPVDVTPVLLSKGEQTKAEYAALNPGKVVPTLEDGDFILTESSSILKYLAEKTRSGTYPAELKARAHVNEVMDWFNTGFYRDVGFGVVYQTVLPRFHFSNPVTQADVINRGKERSVKWLRLLNDHWLRESGFVCGPELTIADYLGSCYVALAEWIAYDIGSYSNIMRWMNAMKSRPSWEKTHVQWNAHAASLRAQVLQPLAGVS
jgi:glutathione S-transferase